MGPLDGDGVNASSLVIPPVRSERSDAEPFVLPDVPAGLARPLAVTAELQTLRGTAIEQRKTVTRAADRVHVALSEQGMEWLFVRNPVDVRRVSASRVDHGRRTIVEYDESELRSTGLARGWADVVSLGVPPEALQALRPTGRKATLAGFEFSERLPAEDGEGDVRELWWSDEASAPLRVAQARNGSYIVVTSLGASVDAALLLDPRRRFPAYVVMDIADFREAHHEPAD